MSKTIEISDELYESLKSELSAGGATEIQGWADFVGQSVFFRTVTYHLVGRVRAVNGSLIELEDASIVFQSGDFAAALKSGTLAESEHVGKAFVNALAVTDAFPWKKSLPKADR